MRLYLFDLDQTLVDVVGVHNLAFHKVLKRYYDIDAWLDEIKFSGMLFSQIIKRICKNHGLASEEIKKHIENVKKDYNTLFAEEMENARLDNAVLPGVRKILEQLQNNCVGIVTGNPEYVVKKVLEKTGLRKYFSAFAYGTESNERSELVKIAIRRAEERCGQKFDAKDVFVIGDSIHDIRSGKANRTRTVAVCTGIYTREELSKENPDFIFDDFSDANNVVDKLRSD